MSVPGGPPIGIVSDCPLQRHQAQTALGEIGYTIAYCRDPERMMLDADLPVDARLWLLLPKDDSDWGELASRFIEQDRVPVLYTEEAIPSRQSEDYLIWRRRLQLKMEKMLSKRQTNTPSNQQGNKQGDGAGDFDGDPSLGPNTLPLPSYLQTLPPGSPADAVVLLAASLGGPEAVKTFLDALPPNLPVGFLYAQHIDDQAAQVLLRVLGRDACYPLVKAQPGEPLRTGEVTLVPINQQLEFDSQQQLQLSDQVWPGPYNPSIEQMIRTASACFRERLHIMVFSGMGEDGAEAASLAKSYGSRIWAQDSGSCANSSMPDAMSQTGCTSFRGPPRALAEKLLKSLESDNLIHCRNKNSGLSP